MCENGSTSEQYSTCRCNQGPPAGLMPLFSHPPGSGTHTEGRNCSRSSASPIGLMSLSPSSV
jgi:hypothetical protein